MAASSLTAVQSTGLPWSLGFVRSRVGPLLHCHHSTTGASQLISNQPFG